ncbi:LAGLIDADG family homing endonuclease [Patescibacteria group bacterium]|nr:LAGLIDADG family homing endonuclease [Patescibacteria group bacterium]
MSNRAFGICLGLKNKETKIPEYKMLPDFWSASRAARKGGLKVVERHGNPGTPKGRVRGGLISQQRRKKYPEFYRKCNLKKDISRPGNSTELAEFIGIILGDGGIGSDYQVVVTVHKENGRQYIGFICSLIKNLFKLTPAVYCLQSPKSKKVVRITISSSNLVDFLLARGLKKGNKVKNQVGVPIWIKKNKKFSKSCLRGLIDTDGCVYGHRHNSHGYNHYNIGLAFTNKSIPLLDFVYNTLEIYNFSPKKQGGSSVRLYRKHEVLRYYQEIGFSNSYHSKRLKNFLNLKKKL